MEMIKISPEVVAPYHLGPDILKRLSELASRDPTFASIVRTIQRGHAIQEAHTIPSGPAVEKGQGEQPRQLPTDQETPLKEMPVAVNSLQAVDTPKPADAALSAKPLLSANTPQTVIASQPATTPQAFKTPATKNPRRQPGSGVVARRGPPNTPQPVNDENVPPREGVVTRARARLMVSPPSVAGPSSSRVSSKGGVTKPSTGPRSILVKKTKEKSPAKVVRFQDAVEEIVSEANSNDVTPRRRSERLMGGEAETAQKTKETVETPKAAPTPMEDEDMGDEVDASEDVEEAQENVGQDASVGERMDLDDDSSSLSSLEDMDLDDEAILSIMESVEDSDGDRSVADSNDEVSSISVVGEEDSDVDSNDEVHSISVDGEEDREATPVRDPKEMARDALSMLETMGMAGGDVSIGEPMEEDDEDRSVINVNDESSVSAAGSDNGWVTASSGNETEEHTDVVMEDAVSTLGSDWTMESDDTVQSDGDGGLEEIGAAVGYTAAKKSSCTIQ